MGGDDDRAWMRQVLLGVGALVVVSLLVGAVVSVLALGAARFTGLSGSADAGPSRAPSLYFPSSSPVTGAAGGGETAGPDSATASARPARPSRQRISLQADQTRVAGLQRINLTGVYRRGEGVQLQVQRFDGGWSDFPTTATVRGGIFTTYVVSGRLGENRFRVLDKSSGRASNPVAVTIG